MINFNGQLVSDTATVSNSNRAFLYGDGVFETLKIVNNKILYLEDHYFRLMASMRIVRMQIPANFTLEFIEQQILALVNELNINDSARVRFTVFRNDGGFYLPETRTISYIIQAFPIENKKYQITSNLYEVDLYKDFFISKQLLSTIKTTNKMINITGSIFADENDLQNCLLINNEKNVVEALNGNLFMVMKNKIITPPISDGCLNGIMRKQIIEIAKKIESYQVVEETISPFDLQKADELFITNVIAGIIPISKYRKKEYQSDVAKELLKKINISVFI
jgi:branched-chain amino acid aminotransferase